LVKTAAEPPPSSLVIGIDDTRQVGKVSPNSSTKGVGVDTPGVVTVFGRSTAAKATRAPASTKTTTLTALALRTMDRRRFRRKMPSKAAVSG
jgi:hypothetical protein